MRPSPPLAWLLPVIMTLMGHPKTESTAYMPSNSVTRKFQRQHRSLSNEQNLYEYLLSDGEGLPPTFLISSTASRKQRTASLKAIKKDVADETTIRQAYEEWCSRYSKEQNEERFNLFARNYATMERITKGTMDARAFGPYADCMWEEYVPFHSGIGADLGSMKVKDLKEVCKKCSITSTGTKATLVERLQVVWMLTDDEMTEPVERGAPERTAEEPRVAVMDEIDSGVPLNLSKLKVKELRAECKKRNIPSSGSKAVLIQRLQTTVMLADDLETTEKQEATIDVPPNSLEPTETPVMKTQETLAEEPTREEQVETVVPDVQMPSEETYQKPEKVTTAAVEAGPGLLEELGDLAGTAGDLAGIALQRMLQEQAELQKRIDAEKAKRVAAQKAEAEKSYLKRKAEAEELRIKKEKEAAEALAAREEERKARQAKQEEEVRKRQQQLELEAIAAAKAAAEAEAASAARIRAMEAEARRTELERARKVSESLAGGSPGVVNPAIETGATEVPSPESGQATEEARLKAEKAAAEASLEEERKTRLARQEEEAQKQQEALEAEAIAAAKAEEESLAATSAKRLAGQEAARAELQNISQEAGQATMPTKLPSPVPQQKPNIWRLKAEKKAAEALAAREEDRNARRAKQEEELRKRREELEAEAIAAAKAEAEAAARTRTVEATWAERPNATDSQSPRDTSQATKKSEITSPETQQSRDIWKIKAEQKAAQALAAREEDRKSRRAKQEEEARKRRETLEAEAIAAAKAEAEKQAAIAAKVKATEDTRRVVQASTEKGAESQPRVSPIGEDAVAAGVPSPDNDAASDVAYVNEKAQGVAESPSGVSREKETRDTTPIKPAFNLFSSMFKIPVALKRKPAEVQEVPSPKSYTQEETSEINVEFHEDKKQDAEPEVVPAHQMEGETAAALKANQEAEQSRLKKEKEAAKALADREAERKARKAKQEEEEARKRRQSLEAEAIAAAKAEAEEQAALAAKVRAAEDAARTEREEVSEVTETLQPPLPQEDENDSVGGTDMQSDGGTQHEVETGERVESPESNKEPRRKPFGIPVLFSSFLKFPSEPKPAEDITVPAPDMFSNLVTFCYTSDLEATSRFYETVLGLSVSLDQETCRIYRIAPGAHLGFCSRESAPSTDGVILTLVSPDVDGWADRLTKLGVTMEKPPSLNEKYNIYHLFFRDPNGYLLEIQRFEDPEWTD